MKKFLSILFIVCICILLLFSYKNSFENMLSNASLKYEVLDSGDIIISVDDVDNLVELFDVDIIAKYKVSDRVIIEGYSDSIKDSVVLNGLKVNIQISINDEYVVVGSPLILGSF